MGDMASVFTGSQQKGLQQCQYAMDFLRSHDNMILSILCPSNPGQSHTKENRIPECRERDNDQVHPFVDLTGHSLSPISAKGNGFEYLSLISEVQG